MISAVTTGMPVDSQVFRANCTVVEQAGDVVYVFTLGQVRQAIANDITKSDAIGIIEKKLSNTTCLVRKMGFIRDIYAGLIIGNYYLSQDIAGELQDEVPSSGIIKLVGNAISDSELYVDTGRIPVIK